MARAGSENKTGKRWRLSTALAAASTWVAGGAVAADLAVGAAAPGFSLPGSDGSTYRLEQYLGKKAVVLAWFPKAFTPG